MSIKLGRILCAGVLGLCSLWFYVSFNAPLQAAPEDPFSITWDEKPLILELGRPVIVSLLFEIPENHYLYQDRTAVSLKSNPAVTLEAVTFPPSKLKHDTFSGEEVAIYPETFAAGVTLKALQASALTEVTLTVTYQGCSPKLCYRQMQRDISIPIKIQGIPQASAAPLAPDLSWNQRLTQQLQAALTAQGALAFVLAFVGGLLTDLTPCVLPILPLTLAVIGLRRQQSLLRHFTLSLSLVTALTLAYALLGLAAALLGYQLGFLFQSPWFLLAGAALFIIFALGMFGVYQFQFPLALRNRLARWSGQGHGGAFIAGLTLGVLAAPCVGPILAALLVWVGQTQNLLRGFALLAAFGLGMGAPILVLGTFYELLSRRLPGGQLSGVVKWTLGILLLIPAAYYGHLAWQGFQRSGVPELKPSQVAWRYDTAEAFHEAAASGRPILVDFYADWCLPCLEWDKKTFAEPSVGLFLKEHAIALKVDCTQTTPQCEDLVTRYQVQGWPTLLLLTAQGDPIPDASLIGEVLTPTDFIRHLQRFIAPD